MADTTDINAAELTKQIQSLQSEQTQLQRQIAQKTARLGIIETQLKALQPAPAAAQVAK